MIPMLVVYRWGGVILRRAEFGGIARSPYCCCDECCCPGWKDFDLDNPAPNMVATITGDISKTITLTPETASLTCATWCGQEEITVICDDGQFPTPVAAYLRVQVECPPEGKLPSDVLITVSIAPTSDENVCEPVSGTTSSDPFASCSPFHGEVDISVVDAGLGCIGSYDLHVEIDEQE